MTLQPNRFKQKHTKYVLLKMWCYLTLNSSKYKISLIFRVIGTPVMYDILVRKKPIVHRMDRHTCLLFFFWWGCIDIDTRHTHIYDINNVRTKRLFKILFIVFLFFDKTFDIIFDNAVRMGKFLYSRKHLIEDNAMDESMRFCNHRFL